MSNFRSTPSHISINYYFVECRHAYLILIEDPRSWGQVPWRERVISSQADVSPRGLRGVRNDLAGTFDLAACSIALRKKGDVRDIMARQQSGGFCILLPLLSSIASPNAPTAQF